MGLCASHEVDDKSHPQWAVLGPRTSQAGTQHPLVRLDDTDSILIRNRGPAHAAPDEDEI